MDGDTGVAGTVALVTGGSRGIGRAYVTALAGAGAQVVALARSFPIPDAALPQALGHDPVVRWRCDVEVPEEIEGAVARVIDHCGRIDILINNAGIFPHHATLATGVDDWDHMMRVNVRGTYLMIREAAPHMVARGSGSIVNLSSGAALHTDRGSPGHEGLLAYGVSKAAVDRLTGYLGEELKATGVAVNAIRPGGVLTDTWRQVDPDAYTDAVESGRGQRCAPEVVGPPMLYLARQTSYTMTGQVVAARDFGRTWP